MTEWSAGDQQQQQQQSPHLDEGTIHAWLDGALSADEARAVETHAAACARCAAAVAEARGLIAAASRILLALDDVPADVLPSSVPVALPLGDVAASSAPSSASSESSSSATVTPIGAAPRRRRFHVTPIRAAAAVLIAAVGTTVVVREASRGGEKREMMTLAADTMASMAATGPLYRPDAPTAPASGERARVADVSAAAAMDTQEAPPRAPLSAPSIAPQRQQQQAAPPSTVGAVGAVAGVARDIRDGANDAQRARRAEKAAAADQAPDVRELAAKRAAPPPAPPAPTAPAAGNAAGALASAPVTHVLAADSSRLAAVRGVVRGVVRGFVRDATTRGPVDGAQVRLVGTSRGAVTDSAGRYAIASVPAGRYVVEARRIGYESRKTELVVPSSGAAADTTAGPDFSLAAAATTLSAVRTEPLSGKAAASSAAAAPSVAAPRTVAPEARRGARAEAYVRVEAGAGAGCYDLRAAWRALPDRVVLDTVRAESVPAGERVPGFAVRAADGAEPLGLAYAYWSPVGADSVRVVLLDAPGSGVVLRARVGAGALRGVVRDVAGGAAVGHGEGTVVAPRASCEP